MTTRPGFLAMSWPPTSVAALRFAVAAVAVVLASILVLRITVCHSALLAAYDQIKLRIAICKQFHELSHA